MKKLAETRREKNQGEGTLAVDRSVPVAQAHCSMKNAVSLIVAAFVSFGTAHAETKSNLVARQTNPAVTKKSATKNGPSSGLTTSPQTTPPGVVINHLPANTKTYLGSPSLAVLPNGNYIVSHDLFGKGSTTDTTLVFESNDHGQSWKQVARIKGLWWSTLFTHHAALYLIGTTKEYGSVSIRRSDDGGHNWTQPTNSDSGLLLSDGPYHCAPVPVIEHNGRIWRAMEDAMGGTNWGKRFRAFMMSAPANADLLKASSWTFSSRLARNSNWLNNSFDGWLEGNAVALRTGEIVDILRVATTNYPEQAAIVHISADGKTAHFNPEKDFVDFPGGAKKFTIRFDRVTKSYWALANVVPPAFRDNQPDRTRNTLALIRSPNCREWEMTRVIVEHPDVKRHGYQYVDWLFDGKDIVAAVRVAHDDAMGGANNYHNSNFITFVRVPDFRAQVKR